MTEYRPNPVKNTWYRFLGVLCDMGILDVPDGCKLTLHTFSLHPSVLHERRLRVWDDGLRVGRLRAEQ